MANSEFLNRIELEDSENITTAAETKMTKIMFLILDASFVMTSMSRTTNENIVLRVDSNAQKTNPRSGTAS